MKILVTGGGGYVGSTLTRRLLQHGYSVRVLDSLLFGGQGLLGVWDDPAFEFVKGDVQDPGITGPALEGVKAVVHLAALVGEPQCKRDPDEAEGVNFLATRRLVNEARAAGVSVFALASTCSNYGLSERNMLADEESELLPLSIYAETKIKAEEAVLSAVDDGFRTLVLRFATVYGLSPRMRFDLLLNEFVRDAVIDNYLLVYGPDSFRPFVHVRDVARFVRLCLEYEGLEGVYNVGGHNLRKRDLVTELLKVAPDLDMDIKESQKDPRNYRVSFARAEAVGFAPEYNPLKSIHAIAAALRSGLFADAHSGVFRNA